jgi:hypothetical protein
MGASEGRVVEEGERSKWGEKRILELKSES